MFFLTNNHVYIIYINIFVLKTFVLVSLYVVFNKQLYYVCLLLSLLVVVALFLKVFFFELVYFLKLVFCLFLFCLETYCVLFVLLGGVGVVPSVCLVSCEFVVVILGTLFFCLCVCGLLVVMFDEQFFFAGYVLNRNRNNSLYNQSDRFVYYFFENSKDSFISLAFQSGSEKRRKTAEYCKPLW